ncbi:MAG: LysM peptidoglycan-binding domain-containing protein [Chloroflexi bacterium]|nr:LysM peptidoglycan-binding domain-containing protein [Chloroflexota bacterium]
MNPRQLKDDIRYTGSRGDQAKLFGFWALMLAAGLGLATALGPPRIPSGLPRLDDVLTVLAGATLPLDALLLVLVDTVWALWAWITLSLLVESVLTTADVVTHGGSAWVRSLRRFADRASVPLVRRAVAAAFAVQVISRGIPIASAQTLPPVDAIVASANNAEGSPTASDDDNSVSAPTHLVRDGDTLWSIAEQAYGSGTEYRRLVDANVGRSMTDGEVFSARGVIRPGWQLVVPGPAWQVQVVDGQRWYIVRPGDSLSSIAASTLGDPLRWPELFDLNRGASTGDGKYTLVDANTIWPGLRLRLPNSDADTDPPPPGEPEPAPTELRAASAAPGTADRHPADPPDLSPGPQGAGAPPATDPDPDPPTVEPTPAPLLRTPHPLHPVALDPADTPPSDPDSLSDSTPLEAAGAGSAGDTEVSVPAPPWRPDVPALPLAATGLGLAGVTGLVVGARRLRRLRPLTQEPESEIVVEDGFAEAQLAHDLTRGLHGIGFDPVSALAAQLEQFLAESGAVAESNLAVLAVRHGRSSTTLTLRCALAEQPLLLELAPTFAHALDADVDACVSADQDVLWRLSRLRKTRLLPSIDAPAHEPCLVPLGVLYDRQVYSVAWRNLGHLLVASMPGHGADTILTSLVATLTARRSPEQLQIWMFASGRALPAPLFEVPHLRRVVDPADESALLQAAEDLRAELDARATKAVDADLLVVIPELSTLGQHAARFALLAARSLALGVRFAAAASDPERAIGDPLTTHFATRMVLRMQAEDASVALLGVADAAFLGGGGRLLLRLDGREPVELYGYQVASEHLERLVRVMRSAYSSSAADKAEPHVPPDEPTSGDGQSQDSGSPPHEPEPRAPVIDPTAARLSVPDQPGAMDAVGQVPVQIYCFGTPRVVCAGHTVWPRSGGDAKPWELLLFLASQPAEGVSRDALANALWPQSDMVEDVAHRVRQLRFRLRRQFRQVPGGPQEDGICVERRVLRMDPALVYSDAQEFLTLVRSVRLNPGDDAIERLEKARALYMGDLLTGPDVRRYAWLDERDDSGVTLREHFRRLFQNASVRLAELYTDAGELVAAIELYRELTEIDPADERLWQALFRLHAQREDRDALVAEEKRLRQTLRDLAEELDIADTAHVDEPGRETALEYQRLLSSLREREPAAV